MKMEFWLLKIFAWMLFDDAKMILFKEENF
jgi:hypothetical protein